MGRKRGNTGHDSQNGDHLAKEGEANDIQKQIPDSVYVIDVTLPNGTEKSAHLDDDVGQKEEPEELPIIPTPLASSRRMGLAVIAFFGMVNLYMLRVNMSVAIVCMVNQTAVDMMDPAPVPDMSVTTLTPWSDTVSDGTVIPEVVEQCLADTMNINETQQDGEFVWDKETQGLIMGSFFWGYLITQIPAGYLTVRYSAKYIYGFCMLVSAICSLLTPVGARASPILLLFLRFISGLGQGVSWPCMHALWSRWAPPMERSKLVAISYAGAQIGNVITFPVSGILCESGFAGGWPSIFYVFGAFGIVWFVCWMVFAFDSPDKHPRCSQAERDYVMRSIGTDKKDKFKRGTPWRHILTSMPVWTIVIAHTCVNWGTYTLMTNIPTYMNEVLKFNITANGVFSAIPYITFWLMITVAGIVADKIIASKCLTVRGTRKLMMCLGMFGPALFLILTGYVTCQDPYVAVGLLAVATAFTGFQYGGVIVNHVDIATPFAGILIGLSNTFATLPGILAPYAIAVITEDQTQRQWQAVFYLSAAIYCIGAIIFLIFAKAEPQDWVLPYMFEMDTDEASVSVESDLQGSRDVLTDSMHSGNPPPYEEALKQQLSTSEITRL